MRKNAKGFNYYLIFIFWISNIFISSPFPVHKLWLLLMPLNFTYQRDPICFDVSYIPHISNRKKLCLVSSSKCSLNGDANTLPMEQYFMHKISKCCDKIGSQIFGFGKYGPCKKLSCEIWWCNMLVLYHILSNNVLSTQAFLLHLCVFKQMYCNCSFWISNNLSKTISILEMKIKIYTFDIEY